MFYGVNFPKFFCADEQAGWDIYVLNYQGIDVQFPRKSLTGEIYNFDPGLVIRAKCCVLTLITPLMSGIRAVYWIGLSFSMLIKKCFHALDGKDFGSGHFPIKNTMKDVPRAIYYGIILTFYAACGVLFPYWGREHYGRNERLLNRHPDGPHRDKFYLAICFQPLAVINEVEIGSEERARNKLLRYIELVNNIRAALLSLDFVSLQKFAGR